MKKITYFLFLLLIGNIGYAQVGIGTDLPNPSTQLEVIASNRGILIPQVALTGSIDTATITAGNVESLLVYNTTTIADITPGYYYWYQGAWKRLVNSDDQSQSDVLVNEGDGVYTHTAVDGTVVTIDVINDVVTSIQNEGDIYNEIINIIEDNDTNTTNVSLTEDGTNLVLTDSDGNTVQVALADLANSIDTNTTNVSLTEDGTNLILEDSDGNTVQVALADLADAIDTNTTNVSLTEDGTDLILTDSDGNTVQVALADLADAIDTNTTNVSLTEDGTDLILTDSDGNTVQIALADLADAIDTNTTNVSLTEDGTDLILTDSDGNTVQVALADLANSIDTNTTNVSLTEDGTDLILTDSDGNTVQVALADLADGIDTNTTNVSLAEDGTNLILTDSDGNTVQVALADLADAIDTNTTNVSLTEDGTDLILTDSDGNTVQIALADLADAIDTNTTNVSLTEDGTDLILTDSDGNTVQVALADLANSIDTNTTNVSLTEDGTDLILTDSDGNTVQVALADLADAIDTNTTNVSLTEDGTDLILTDSDGNTVQVALADLADAIDTNTTNVSLTEDGTDLILTDSDGNTVQVALADLADAIDTNTTNVSLTEDGADLILTDSDGNTVQIALADLASSINTDDQIITDLSVVTGELSVTIEDGNTENVNLISADVDNALTAGADGALFVPEVTTLTEPWFDQDTDTEATDNTQNIYQMGNIAIGKTDNLVGTALDIEGAVRGGTGHSGTIGANSVAFGENNIASAQGTVAMGASNNVTGLYGQAYGFQNTVSASSTAMGQDNTVSAINSFVAGIGNQVDGENSYILGDGNTVTSNANFNSVALGEGNIMDNSGYILGNLNEITGPAANAVVLGYQNTAANDLETVLGHYNAITTNIPSPTESPLLQVGNGANSGARTNALTILNNGNIGTDLAIAPTERLDIGSGNVRVRDINTNIGDTATDNVVVADADGVLKTVAVGDIAVDETITTLGLNAGELVYTNEDGTNPNVPLISADIDNVLVAGTDGALFVPEAAAGVNIYNADGTLSENRTVNMDSNSLTFDGPNQTTSIEDFTFRVQGITGAPFGNVGNIAVGSGLGNNGIRTNLYLQSFADGDAQIFAGEGATSLIIGTHATNQPAPIAFSTTDTGGGLSQERARISPDGLLGLDTTTPTERLDIGSGNVRVRDINTNIGDTATDNVVVADADGVLKTVAVGDIAIDETITTLGLNAGELVYTNEDGTNPNVPLISADIDNVLVAGTDGALFVPEAEPSVNIYNANNTLTSNRTVTQDGNWLRFSDVQETTFFNTAGSGMRQNSGSGNRASITLANGGTNSLFLYTDNNAAAQILASGNSTSLNIGTNNTANPTPLNFTTSPGGGATGSQRAQIAGDGRFNIINTLSIGFPGQQTFSGDVKLRVNGSILTTTSIYADYVFEDYFKGYSELNKEYAFKSLQEVEQFISENRHLPGITKIDALEKNEKGDYVINASELSVQLLEKVEELYLHTIEQQEQLDKKEAEIKALKAKQQEMEQRIERMEKLLLGKQDLDKE